MTMVIANTEMAKAWNGQEGEEWARDWSRYDRAAAGYQRRLLAAAGILPGEHVLDIGCGNGEASRAAGRAAGPAGSVLGVDLSSAMVRRAQALAGAEGLANVRFEQADAQVHSFEPAAHEVVISRFGTMFFGDPVAAFANLAGATRPGGRLVIVAWQAPDRNEWIREIRGALAAGRSLPTPAAGAPGPFGQADPDHARTVLVSAGWTDVVLESAEEPFWIGADAEDAFGFMSTGGMARGMLADLDESARSRALEGLRATMAAHANGKGVVFGSAAWVISAIR
jgi:SAM-dependent methyltransferase